MSVIKANNYHCWRADSTVHVGDIDAYVLIYHETKLEFIIVKPFNIAMLIVDKYG